MKLQSHGQLLLFSHAFHCIIISVPVARHPPWTRFNVYKETMDNRWWSSGVENNDRGNSLSLFLSLSVSLKDVVYIYIYTHTHTHTHTRVGRGGLGTATLALLSGLGVRKVGAALGHGYGVAASVREEAPWWFPRPSAAARGNQLDGSKPVRRYTGQSRVNVLPLYIPLRRRHTASFCRRVSFFTRYHSLPFRISSSYFVSRLSTQSLDLE